MSLIDKDYVFKYFPLWEKFFVDPNGDPDETILESEITLAEAEFGRYVTRTAENISSAEKSDVLIILRKRGFDRLHGDTAFETKPQIIKDYEAAITSLRLNASTISVTANEKKFTGGNWFNDPSEDV